MTVMGQPTRAHGRTIPVTCQTHGGARGFCNLRIRKADGDIVLDPHVTGSCGPARAANPGGDALLNDFSQAAAPGYARHRQWFRLWSHLSEQG